MANVLHKTTMPADYRRSVNTSEYPLIDWYHNPDISAVFSVPRKYWVLGQTVVEMDAAAKAAVDAADAIVQADAVADEFDQPQTIMRAFAEVLIDELNAHSAKTNAILDAIDGAASLAGLKTAVSAISDLPSRNIAELKTAVRTKL